MTKYNDLMDYGKSIFNFHPQEEFESINLLLKTAEKNIRENESYLRACGHFAKALAAYIDGENS